MILLIWLSVLAPFWRLLSFVSLLLVLVWFVLVILFVRRLTSVLLRAFVWFSGARRAASCSRPSVPGAVARPVRRGLHVRLAIPCPWRC